jgi:hypothetical protein
VLIYFCSAPCGSGKTHSLVQQACDWARSGRNIAILQPTKELIDKTVEQELIPETDAPKHKVFHGDTVPGSVAQSLTDYLKCPIADAQIVFATHQILPYIGFWPNKSLWKVLIDEPMQAHRHNCFIIPDTHRLITDLVGVAPYNSIYGRMEMIDHGAMQKMALNPDHDEIFESFRELAQTLVSPNWESFVNSEQFEKLKNGKQRQLSVHSVLKPSVLAGFGSVTIAGANFTDSMIYRLWTQQGVNFQEDSALGSSLKFQEHQNGHLIVIKYGVDAPWSRKRRLKLVRSDQTVMDAIMQAAEAEFGDSPFLWQANKDVADNLFGSNGQRLPNIPHGLNDYSHFNNIVFLSSLNPSADHFSFLKTQGVEAEEVRRAIYLEALYQSVMRSSIRDAENTEAKTVIVPDLAAAEYLKERFPGSCIEKLKIDIPIEAKPKKAGRPRKHREDRDRKAQYRQRKKLKLLREQLLLKNRPYQDVPLLLKGNAMIGDEKGIRLYTNFVSNDQTGTVTVYRDKKSNNPAGFVHCDDVELFAGWLKQLHGRELSTKEDNLVLSPAIFDPNHPNREGNRRRGRSNIAYLRHIWLDFEGGELRPEELPELFPRNRLVVCNSYNHTHEKPRFRAILLTDSSMTPEAYEVLWDNIAAKIGDAGYSIRAKESAGENLRPSGLDYSKRSSASLFWAPCQSKNPADSFFRYYNQPPRQLLDPIDWIENNVVQFSMPSARKAQSTTGQGNHQAAVELATAEWRKSPQHPGQGNYRFFEYALALRAAGMGLGDIEGKLRSEAIFGRNPKERTAQIPSIMASLQKSRRSVA